MRYRLLARLNDWVPVDLARGGCWGPGSPGMLVDVVLHGRGLLQAADPVDGPWAVWPISVVDWLDVHAPRHGWGSWANVVTGRPPVHVTRDVDVVARWLNGHGQVSRAGPGLVIKPSDRRYVQAWGDRWEGVVGGRPVEGAGRGLHRVVLASVDRLRQLAPVHPPLARALGVRLRARGPQVTINQTVRGGPDVADAVAATFARLADGDDRRSP